MSKKDNTGGMVLPVGIAAAIVVGLLWTSLTGALWQWIPILAAVAVCLRAGKALKTGR